MHPFRTHFCAALAGEVGGLVRVAGWIRKKRRHRKAIFIDLSDQSGDVQLVISRSSAPFMIAKDAPVGSAISAAGQVRVRSGKDGSKDAEVQVNALEVLGPCAPLPIVPGDRNVPESLRLRYRYLDLRSDHMHRNLVLRSEVLRHIRTRMADQGFIEFHTPLLNPVSPLGAREFLVPSRMHPGRFYALPQGPYLFKQLLMVGGFDRYFQIAPCLRDEGTRARKSSGEYYAIDIEMAFATQEDIFAVIEDLFCDVFRTFASRPIGATPFPRIPYRTAIERFGTDKPDLRISLEIEDVTSTCGPIVADVLPSSAGDRVYMLRVENQGHDSLRRVERLCESHDGENGWRLSRLWFSGTKMAGSIAGMPPSDRLSRQLPERLRLHADTLLLFCSGPRKHALPFMGRARESVGRELMILRPDEFEFCWITDYPLYVRVDQNGFEFFHKWFSMPKGGIEALRSQDPSQIDALYFGLICNGSMVGEGGIRNHEPETIYRACEIAGHPREEVWRRFKTMITALGYGAPPHGGIAPSFELLLGLLAEERTARDLIAFPLNQNREDLVSGAPEQVTADRLMELNIALSAPYSGPPAEDLLRPLPHRRSHFSDIL